MKLKNYAENLDEIPETSLFVEIYNDGERRVVVKKSSLCWLLREDGGKLSSDRIERVKGIHQTKKKKKIRRQNKVIKRQNILRRRRVND